jgi:hypothetical protein
MKLHDDLRSETQQQKKYFHFRKKKTEKKNFLL